MSDIVNDTYWDGHAAGREMGRKEIDALSARLAEAEAALVRADAVHRDALRSWANDKALVTRLTEALRRLVSLKDGPHDSMYLREKPKAWERARALLAEVEP